MAARVTALHQVVVTRVGSRPVGTTGMATVTRRVAAFYQIVVMGMGARSVGTTRMAARVATLDQIVIARVRSGTMRSTGHAAVRTISTTRMASSTTIAIVATIRINTIVSIRHSISVGRGSIERGNASGSECDQ